MHGMTAMQPTTHAQELVALRYGRPVPDLLREMHLSRGMSQVAIAAELGLSRQTVAMWLREHGVRRGAAS